MEPHHAARPPRWSEAIVLIRLLVGPVLVTEGIQKFLFPDLLGVGRFIKIGIPSPEILAPFVGLVEIVCGSLIVFGLFTRLSTIPVIISMLVAIATTKVPMVFAKGFWATAHEARTDWAMIFGLVFLLIVGGGRWSADELMKRKAKPAVTKGSDIPGQ